jgi:hypothetical protein
MEEQQPELSEEEALMKLAAAMKDNAPTTEDKQSVHTFLFNVVTAENSIKVGNLRDDKDYNELGFPNWTVRGCLDMARVSGKVMDNKMFEEYFLIGAEDTLASSLSRNGFLVKQATTQTKQVADVTRRRKINSGWFKKSTEETGGDTTSSSGQT